MNDQLALRKKPQKRASKPKVTTGCTTCKARHVKCDERKPTCIRCTNSRKQCIWNSPKQVKQPSLPLFDRDLSLTPNPETLPGGDQERHSFQFFKTKTITQLCGFFDSKFWSYEVLQACMNEPAVWHATVALGSLHQQARLGYPKKKGAELSCFTVQQYVQAVGILGKPSADHQEASPETTLICCVIFTCFETLRGHHAAAFMHLKSGLKLLSELWQPDLDSIPPQTYKIPSSPLTSLQSISLILTRLEIQTTHFLSYQTTFLIPLTATKARQACRLHMPRTFTTIESARCASDYLWTFLLYTFDAPTPHSIFATYGTTAAVKVQQCAQLLDQWFTAFTRFLANPSVKLDATAKQAANIMRINQLNASMSLAPAPAESETEQQFSEIISLATAVVDAPIALNQGLEEGEIRFSMDTAVVGPLYHAALRCKHGILRRKAIALLRLRVRVEGLWNSVFLADVTERVMDIEEGVYGEEVRDVKVMFDFEGKKAEVQFWYLEGNEETRKVEVVDWI